MTLLPPNLEKMSESVPAEEPARISGIALLALMFSIAGVLLMIIGVGAILSAVGLILGLIAVTQINNNPQRLAGKGYALGGVWVAVVTLLLVGFAVLTAGHNGHGELRFRSTCAANMMGILKACVVYANENNDVFPTAGNPSALNTYVTATGVVASAEISSIDDAAKAVHSTPGAQGNPVACLWLLALKNQIAPKSLICRSDPAVSTASPLQDADNKYRLTPETAGQISYSIAYPWAGSSDVGEWWRNINDSSLPVMSEMAPADASKLCTEPGAVGKDYNSLNHGGEGQNVGYADAHVDWARKPDVGQSGEMIFATGIAGGPQTIFHGGGTIPWSKAPAAVPYDTVMVPAREMRSGRIK